MSEKYPGELEKVQPFANGTQYTDWMLANCYHCTKCDPDHLPTCEIDMAIGVAAITDGEITAEIAQRMGYQNDNRYIWQCPELSASHAAAPRKD